MATFVITLPKLLITMHIVLLSLDKILNSPFQIITFFIKFDKAFPGLWSFEKMLKKFSPNLHLYIKYEEAQIIISTIWKKLFPNCSKPKVTKAWELETSVWELKSNLRLQNPQLMDEIWIKSKICEWGNLWLLQTNFCWDW